VLPLHHFAQSIRPGCWQEGSLRSRGRVKHVGPPPPLTHNSEPRNVRTSKPAWASLRLVFSFSAMASSLPSPSASTLQARVSRSLAATVRHPVRFVWVEQNPAPLGDKRAIVGVTGVKDQPPCRAE